MNALAAFVAPDIYGAVQLRDPTWTDSPWFWPGAAALAVVLAGVAWLIIRRWQERRRERALRDPLFILCKRMAALHQDDAAPGSYFYRQLASVMREAVGMRFKMSATPKTARELDEALAGVESAALADGALKVLRECEAVLFSGAEGGDARQLTDEADAAFKTLLPDTLKKTEGEAAVR
jgi:hypothetical protein